MIHTAILALPDSYWKRIKLEDCEKLIKDCLGLFAEVRTNKFKASPGSELLVTLEVINRSTIEVRLVSMEVHPMIQSLPYRPRWPTIRATLKNFLFDA